MTKQFQNGNEEFPKLKDTLLPNNIILEVNPIKRLISWEYNVENEVARNMYERSELDYLIYNAPLEYADLILNGDPETYLKTVTEYKNLD